MKASKRIFQKRLRQGALIVLLPASMAASSCSTFSVHSIETPKTDDIKTRTAVSFFWGLSDPDLKEDCNSEGLEFVSAKTNLLYSLCSVATLGIITPMTLEYRCAGPGLNGGGGFGTGKGKTP